jgi:hypothetical protein
LSRPVPSSPLPLAPSRRFAGIICELGGLEGTKGIPDKEEVPGSSPGSPTRRNSDLRCIWSFFRFLAVCGSARSRWSVGPRWGHQLLPAGGKRSWFRAAVRSARASENAVCRVLRELSGERGTFASAVRRPAQATSTGLVQAPSGVGYVIGAERRRSDDRRLVRVGDTAHAHPGGRAERAA